MRTNCKSFLKRALNDQRGQILPLVMLGVVGFLGMAGLTIDVGRAYVVRRQLQSVASAAALAASGSVYNADSTNNATTVANQYAASSGDLNANSSMGTVTTTVTTKCLNMLMAGTTCAKSGNIANAVQVTEKANVPTIFMQMFGVKTLTVGATATASMQGTAQLWNVAIILDATGSMGSVDKYCSQSGSTAEQCAMTGIQTMLRGINPCAGGAASCSAASANANFRVSLFAFPNVPTATVANDYNCGGAPVAEVYTLPVIPSSGSTSGYTPFTYTSTTTNWRGQQTKTTTTYTYQITPPKVGNADANGFLSDYYANGTLNSKSILVKAVGDGSTNGCMTPPSTSGWPDGSYETYFAGAIYAAQAALQAEQSYTTGLGINAKNAIIFISDGQANMTYDGFPQATSTAGTAGSGGYSVTSAGNTTYSTKAANLTGVAGTWGTYPDSNADCQQAIMAAQYVQKAGTRFYAVAYGSESGGCVTDVGTVGTAKLVLTGALNVPITSASQVVPCKVMENMASPGADAASPWYFYTDGSSTANGCKDTSHTSSDLNSIFGAITATFTNPRLLPNNAT